MSSRPWAQEDAAFPSPAARAPRRFASCAPPWWAAWSCWSRSCILAWDRWSSCAQLEAPPSLFRWAWASWYSLSNSLWCASAACCRAEAALSYWPWSFDWMSLHWGTEDFRSRIAFWVSSKSRSNSAWRSLRRRSRSAPASTVLAEAPEARPREAFRRSRTTSKSSFSSEMCWSMVLAIPSCTWASAKAGCSSTLRRSSFSASASLLHISNILLSRHSPSSTSLARDSSPAASLVRVSRSSASDCHTGREESVPPPW
mmetsp:Transcript_55430/g.149474  ORF Transcript_55430/g.149474 Transcript_55430/m.149474 type:complete len:257 (+) Transcript_55430:1905-2675(+)